MKTLDTTELKLKTTPTGGAEAHASPYYRRLVSAGYKGFLQGTIGGASLYGLMGAAVGGLVALAFGPWLGMAAFALIPAGAGLGVMKGASTFGNIGSFAAINAESADLAEQRRYLLDRYYDLPEGPEGDREAEAIKQELIARERDTQKPPHFFHWKTVLVGALLGAALAAAAIFVLGGPAALASADALTKALLPIGIHISETFASTIVVKLGVAGIAALGTATGALAGATIGIDRYYIRKWFDHTQDIVQPSGRDYGLMERHQQVERLQDAAKQDQHTRQQQQALREASAPPPATTETRAITPATQPAEAAPAQKKPMVSLEKVTPEKPTRTISAARHEGLMAIHRAMEIPAM